MKLELKKLLCFFTALVMIASLFSACRGKDDGPTATLGEPESGWKVDVDDVEDMPTVQEMPKEELDKLIQSVLGGETEWDGDFSALTEEQQNRIRNAMKARGYDVRVTDRGITYLSYTPVPEKSELDKLIQTALGDGVEWDGDFSQLTASQIKAVQNALKEAGYQATVSNAGITYESAPDEKPKPKRYYETPSESRVLNEIRKRIGSDEFYLWDGNLSSLDKEVVDSIINELNQQDRENGYNVGLSEDGESIVPLEKPPETTTAPETTTKKKEEPEKKVSIERTLLKTVGGKASDIFKAVAATPDGGFVAALYTTSMDGDLAGMNTSWAQSNVAVIKFDASGGIVWKQYLGGDNIVDIYDLAVLTDGSIVGVGYSFAKKMGTQDGPLDSWSTSAVAFPHEALIVKYSADGEFQWIKSVKGSSSDTFASVAATPDGDFIVGGKSTSYDGDFDGLTPGAISAVILRYTADGNTVQWARGFPGEMHSQIDRIAVARDGSVYAACNTLSTTLFFADKAGHGARDCVLIKLNINGEIVWTKTLFSSGNDEFTGLALTPDGGVVVGGFFSQNALVTGTFDGITVYGSTDAALVKVDRNGNIGWITHIGGSSTDAITNVVAVDGGYAVAGWTQSDNYDFAEVGNKGDWDVFVAVISESGKLLQKMTSLAGSDMERAYALTALDGKTIVSAGMTRSADGAFAGLSPAGTAKSPIGYIAKFSIVAQ
ncbi:MAG: hypothetical protein FWF05_07440 [Oscillospiraceae bacterium]|nr:hypothetical protein [Oscillospiraceae bacterium]